MSEIVMCPKCGNGDFDIANDPAIYGPDGKIYHKYCLEEDPVETLMKKYPDVRPEELEGLYDEGYVSALDAEWTVVWTSDNYEYVAKGYPTRERLEEAIQSQEGEGWDVTSVYHKSKPVKFHVEHTITIVWESD